MERSATVHIHVCIEITLTNQSVWELCLIDLTAVKCRNWNTHEEWNIVIFVIYSRRWIPLSLSESHLGHQGLQSAPPAGLRSFVKEAQSGSVAEWLYITLGVQGYSHSASRTMLLCERSAVWLSGGATVHNPWCPALSQPDYAPLWKKRSPAQWRSDCT
jgi:hypothetical protein